MFTYNAARTTIIEGFTRSHEQTSTNRTACDGRVSVVLDLRNREYCDTGRIQEFLTNGYHLHVTTLEIAGQLPSALDLTVELL